MTCAIIFIIPSTVVILVNLTWVLLFMLVDTSDIFHDHISLLVDEICYGFDQIIS